jgi:hypothetical protein
MSSSIATPCSVAKISRRFGETCYMHLRVTTVSRTRAVQNTVARKKLHGPDSEPIRNVCSKVRKQNTFLPISFATTVNYALRSSSTVYFIRTNKMVGRDSSVGIATGYGLDGPGIESRWEARFSAPVQTGPGAHPASYTIGTGSFLGG